MAQSQDLILYHYTFSPYAKRVVWYLNLRGIPYTQCLQPPIMPRPDVAAIGTSYRRIPVLSCGLDIYNDTRLILSKLNTLYPPSSAHPSISASTEEQKGIEKLLEFWAVHGLFTKAAALIPSEMPLLKDEKFRKDREDYTGTSWQPENLERGRSEALVEVRNAFELLETTLLADGREWILKTETPSLGDIEAIWPFHWLTTLPGALTPSYISVTHFPKVFAWISRFDKYTRAAAKKAGKPKTIKGDEAVRIMHQAGLVEASIGVDEGDPSGLRLGEMIEVWPTDSGVRHRDRGRLVGLNEKEVVVQTQGGQVAGVRVHVPRHGFRLRRVKEGKL